MERDVFVKFSKTKSFEELDYFIQHFLPAFEGTLDEI